MCLLFIFACFCGRRGFGDVCRRLWGRLLFLFFGPSQGAWFRLRLCRYFGSFSYNRFRHCRHDDFGGLGFVGRFFNDCLYSGCLFRNCFYRGGFGCFFNRCLVVECQAVGKLDSGKHFERLVEFGCDFFVGSKCYGDARAPELVVDGPESAHAFDSDAMPFGKGVLDRGKECAQKAARGIIVDACHCGQACYELR